MRNQLPIYIQHEKAECGYACIAMILTYLGHPIEICELRHRFGAVSQGMSLFQIRRVFSSFNIHSQAMQVSINDLIHLSFPVLLHWNLDHFVVLTKIKKNRYWIHDPAVGIRVCDLDEMSRFFTGVVLSSEPNTEFTAIRKKKKLHVFDFMRCVSGGKKLLAWLIVTSLLVESGQMIQAVLMQYMTDSVVGIEGGTNIAMIAFGMLGICSLFVGLDYLKGRVSLGLSTQLKTQFSINAMRHLLSLPLTFFEQRQVGQIHLIFQAVETIQKKCGVDLVQGLTEFFLMGLYVLVMTYYSWTLSLIVGLSLLVSSFIRYISVDKLRTYKQMTLNYHGHCMSIFLETLQMMMPVKAYAKELSLWSKWRNAYVTACNSDISVSHVEISYQAAIQLCLYSEYVVLVCCGAYLIEAKQLSLGMLVAFLAFRVAFVAKATSFIQRVCDYYLVGVELERVQDLIMQEPEEAASGKGSTLGQTNSFSESYFSIEAVTYSYNLHQLPILDDLNLTIHAGEKLVIVGKSGCGKSTLLKIMMGLFIPTKGQVKWKGQSIQTLGLQNYRQHIACVLQDDKLMSGTIAENIVFFEEEIDRDWVQEVAQMAAIHETIMSLPMQYATRLSEIGSGMSGGEKQRLLLARALYKRPQLLFLDEASSHLDTATEKRVNHALTQLNITQVIVAHRQETIAMADRVIELSGGKIIC